MPYLYLTCGRQEGLLAPNREFAALLERYKIAHEFHDVPGGHDWNQWNTQLPALFESLRRNLESPDRGAQPGAAIESTQSSSRRPSHASCA